MRYVKTVALFLYCCCVFFFVFFCEGLREKEHDALLRARRPPMTFTGLLIFRFPSRRNVSPFARSLAIDPVIYNGVFLFFSLPTAFSWPLQPWLLFYKIDPLLWTYFFFARADVTFYLYGTCVWSDLEQHKKEKEKLICHSVPMVHMQ
jgi:hypothetical protein